MKYSRVEINSLVVHKQNLLIDVISGGALKFFLCIEILARTKISA